MGNKILIYPDPNPLQGLAIRPVGDDVPSNAWWAGSGFKRRGDRREYAVYTVDMEYLIRDQ